MTTTAKCFLFDGPHDGNKIEGTVDTDYDPFLPGMFEMHSPAFGDGVVYFYQQLGWKFVQEGKEILAKAHYRCVGYRKNSNGRLTYNGEA